MIKGKLSRLPALKGKQHEHFLLENLNFNHEVAYQRIQWVNRILLLLLLIHNIFQAYFLEIGIN